MEKFEFSLDDRFGKRFKGKYVFEGISWGALNRITGECTIVNPATQRSIVDIKQLNAKMLLATLKEMPAEINYAVLTSEGPNGLPPALGELLMAIADKVNGYSPEERERSKKLKEQWGLE